MSTGRMAVDMKTRLSIVYHVCHMSHVVTHGWMDGWMDGRRLRGASCSALENMDRVKERQGGRASATVIP